MALTGHGGAIDFRALNPSNYTGGSEIEVYGDLLLPRLATPTVIASTASLNPAVWGTANISDKNAGTFYAAANGAGVGTHIDFDFGESRSVGAMEILDQRGEVTAGQLVFSDQSDFGVTTAVVNYSQTALPTLVDVGGVTARYARWQVTVYNAGASANIVVHELAFFQAAPEPSTMALLASAGCFVARRRR